jgi:hypothetical protein
MRLTHKPIQFLVPKCPLSLYRLWRWIAIFLLGALAIWGHGCHLGGHDSGDSDLIIQLIR